MQYAIDHRPSYSLVKVRLDAGEAMDAEAGAMVALQGGLEMETKARGGIIKGLKRSLLGGESFFLNRFHARQTGELWLAPALPGDIHVTGLNRENVFFQSGSYLGHYGHVDVDSKWGGAKTFFSSEGLFLIKASGTGSVFFSSYGAIQEQELAAGQVMVVDTGHVVGFTEGVQYDVQRSGGWKSTLFGGEGLVVRLTGPGKVWIQSRSSQAFLSWLIPRLPSSSSSTGG